jgi:hypothetical protein
MIDVVMAAEALVPKAKNVYSPNGKKGRLKTALLALFEKFPLTRRRYRCNRSGCRDCR